ncbi:hypothetical protein C7S20_16390 [Christiangramia fulva]|uniref:Adhesin domain-containing protein n=1 Tax=Christiangramia fulva TaxID=2126553 RepID=A0A2R3Z8W7_9FLAO|nr:hypothetical protein [Christiangramia fulva]AVR46717.1 hypothetical protein C7S20_16390 [Christiangramia fulva]
MKTILSSLIFMAVLGPRISIFPHSLPENERQKNSVKEAKHTEEKKIKKAFNVSATSDLTIDNSYGNVDVTTWDENRVVIEVTVKTSGDDEDKVKSKLDNISVDFEQNSSGVIAKTRFSKEGKSWWKSLFEGFNNVNMEINYVIKAPVQNNLHLSNDYGGIYIDKTSGNTKINCDYGKIDIGELHGDSNYLNFDYSRNSHIGFVTNAEINADYSDYEVGEASSLKVNADYTNSKINKVSRMQFSCDYGSLTLDKVKILRGNGDYLTTKINRVFTSVDVNMDYGSLSIEKIIKGAREINIKTDYTGVKIGYDNEMAFQFQVKTSYGDISGLDGLNVTKRRKENTSNEVSGYYGSENDGAIINISTSYGNVNFNRK